VQLRQVPSPSCEYVPAEQSPKIWEASQAEPAGQAEQTHGAGPPARYVPAPHATHDPFFYLECLW
jgi:hypothetical protein